MTINSRHHFVEIPEQHQPVLPAMLQGNPEIMALPFVEITPLGLDEIDHGARRFQVPAQYFPEGKSTEFLHGLAAESLELDGSRGREGTLVDFAGKEIDGEIFPEGDVGEGFLEAQAPIDTSALTEHPGAFRQPVTQ